MKVVPALSLFIFCVLLAIASSEKKIEDSWHGLVRLNRGNWGEFVNGGTNVLVKFFANWCGHCQALAPEYARLAEHYRGHGGIIIAEVDVDAEQALARANHLEYVPLMRFFRQGRPEPFDCGHAFDQLVQCVEARLPK